MRRILRDCEPRDCENPDEHQGGGRRILISELDGIELDHWTKGSTGSPNKIFSPVKIREKLCRWLAGTCLE